MLFFNLCNFDNKLFSQTKEAKLVELPRDLVRNLQDGRVVLFLGSGASIGAEHSSNNVIPIANELGEMLAERFLGPEFADRPLANIAELAIVETDLFSVQKFIADIFSPFEPADFHKLIPTFKWKAIVTTNYDLIVEKAYEQVKNPIQKLNKYIKNGKRFEFQNSKELRFFKLHGSIDDIFDEKTPLILSTDQYVNCRDNRTRLFTRLEELFYDFPFVFVGHRLQDFDLRQIMLELIQKTTAYPSSYIVLPDLSEPDIHFYERKRISYINSTFEGLLKAANAAIPKQNRVLSILQDTTEHPIIKKLSLSPDKKPSPSLMTLVNRDTDYVSPEINPTEFDVKLFYKGYFPDWTPIILNLDVPRGITKKLMHEIILESVDRDPYLPEFFVLKGPAGSGKSIILRRLAWDSSKELRSLCLWLKNGQIPNYEALIELYRLSGERIFLFIDPVTENFEIIQETLIRALKDKIPITIISAERDHEWNNECEELEPYLKDEYRLRNLNEKEVDNLIELLRVNNSLGYMEGMPLEKQREMLTQRAARQLLVALHEATQGKPFSDIIHDEYNSINSIRAKSLYLTVCIFDRLGVHVRAGLISRVHNIPFTNFKEELFAPLESVVFTYYDQRIQDNVYRSRHSHIADIVFVRVLTDTQDRIDEYMRIIEAVDYDYSSDREAFHGITRAKELINLFSDPQTIRILYTKAKERVGQQPWLLQQEAIFEMNSSGGSLEKASRLLERAIRISPNNRLILHSLAELLLNRSYESSSFIERRSFRERARKQTIDLINSGHISSYPYHTLIKVDLEELKDIIIEGDDPTIGRAIKNLQETIDRATQIFPEDPFIASTEADFLRIINESDKALEALKRAFRANKASPYIAIRLANVYESNGSIDEAIETLEESLEIKPNSKNVNYKLAKLLQLKPDTPTPLLQHYFSRSFTEGDANYSAQFEFARLLYLDRNLEKAKEIFDKLSYAKVAIRIKDKPRGIVKSPDGKILEFVGELVRKESSYGFILRDQFADQLFTHEAYSDSIEWDNLYLGQRFSFTLAFNYRGAIAINLNPM